MKNRTYHALVAEKKDGCYQQTVKKIDVKYLPSNDVLIRVKYSSLNYKDALSATGNKGVTKNYPFTPGIDAAGVIESSRDQRFRAGQKVIVTSYDLGMNTPGGFGQYISVPVDWIVPLPAGLTLKEAMIIGTSGLTAAIGIEKILLAGITPGDDQVIVTGATGGVGSFAVGLLSQLGYKVVAVTGKKDAHLFLKRLGAAEILSREQVTNIQEKYLLSSRWIAAVDTVGGQILDCVIRQTAHNGIVTCCGNVAGHELQTNIYPFILRGVSLMGIDSGIALMKDRLRIWNRLSAEWRPVFFDFIYRTVSLGNLPDEIKKIKNGGQVGTVVVDLDAV